MPLITDQPAHQRKKEFTKGRMDVEEIRPLQVIRRKLHIVLALPSFFAAAYGIAHPDLSEVHLVKNDLSRM